MPKNTGYYQFGDAKPVIPASMLASIKEEAKSENKEKGRRARKKGLVEEITKDDLQRVEEIQVNCPKYHENYVVDKTDNELICPACGETHDPEDYQVFMN